MLSGSHSACRLKYSTPPSASSASRIIERTSAVILFGTPLRRPFPAFGGFGVAVLGSILLDELMQRMSLVVLRKLAVLLH